MKRHDEGEQENGINQLDADQMARIVQERSDDAEIEQPEMQDYESHDDDDNSDAGGEQMAQMPQISNDIDEMAPEMFLVEALLAKKRVAKVTHYLVKWQGFEEPTWEPHSNIPSELKRRFSLNAASDNI